MTREQQKQYRSRLEALNRRLVGQFQTVRGEALRQTGGEASGNLSNVPLHPADLGTDSAEHEVDVLLLENEGYLLNQIRAALSRIESEEFGRCGECRRDIPAPRLAALPYTPYCVDCARRLEETGMNGKVQ
jgi:RNA polymerase-binding transcription factor DksA